MRITLNIYFEFLQEATELGKKARELKKAAEVLHQDERSGAKGRKWRKNVKAIEKVYLLLWKDYVFSCSYGCISNYFHIFLKLQQHFDFLLIYLIPVTDFSEYLSLLSVEFRSSRRITSCSCSRLLEWKLLGFTNSEIGLTLRVHIVHLFWYVLFLSLLIMNLIVLKLQHYSLVFSSVGLFG